MQKYLICELSGSPFLYGAVRDEILIRAGDRDRLLGWAKYKGYNVKVRDLSPIEQFSLIANGDKDIPCFTIIYEKIEAFPGYIVIDDIPVLRIIDLGE